MVFDRSKLVPILVHIENESIRPITGSKLNSFMNAEAYVQQLEQEYATHKLRKDVHVIWIDPSRIGIHP